MSKVRKTFESSYKIPPKEMIMTRHKSALLKTRLRRKDRSVTNIDSVPNITALKTRTKKKRGKKKEEKLNKTTEKQEVEFYPNLKKRFYVQKPFLKPQMKLKVICGTKSDNKRKLHIPIKTSNSTNNSSHKITKSNVHDSENIDMSEIDTCQSPEYSELSMNEILRFTEDTQDLTDEDFIEILTCPSPVWWEDPPEEEVYIEESIFTRPPAKVKPIKCNTNVKESGKSLHATDEYMSKNDKFKMKQANLENIISCVKNKNDRSGSDDGTTNNNISSYTYKTIAENKQSCLLETEKHEISNNNQTFPSSKNTIITERYSISSDNDDLLSLDINLNNEELLEQLENTEIPIENQTPIGNKIINNDNKNKKSKYCLPNATTTPDKRVNDVDLETLLQKNIVHRKVIHIMDPEQQSNNMEPPSKVRRYKKIINGFKRTTGYITLKNVDSNEIIKIVKTRRPSEQELMSHKRKIKKDNELKKTGRACNIQDIPNFNKVVHKKGEDVSLVHLKNELLKYVQENVKKNSEVHKLVSYQVRDNIDKFTQSKDKQKVKNLTNYKTLPEIKDSLKPDKLSAPKINTAGHKTYTNTNNIILDTVNKTNTNLIQSINPTQNNLSLSIPNAVVASNELIEVASIEMKIPESNTPISTDTILSLNTDIIQGKEVISNLEAIETNEIKVNRRKNKITKTLQTEKQLGELITLTKIKRKINPPLKFSSREFCLGNGIRGVQKLLKHDHKNHVRKLKFKSDNKNVAVQSSKINNIESVKTPVSNKNVINSSQSNSNSTPILGKRGNLKISVKNCDVKINNLSHEKVAEKTSEAHEADDKYFNLNTTPNPNTNASKNALQSELSNTVAKLFGPLPTNDIKLSKIEDSKVEICNKTHSSLANSESVLIEQSAKITKKSPKKGNCSTVSSKKGLIKNTSVASKTLNERLHLEHMETNNGKLYAKYYPTKRRVSLLKTNRNLNELDNHDDITNDINNKKESTVEIETYYPFKRRVSLLKTNINLNHINNHDNVTNDIINKKESPVEKEKSIDVSINDPDIRITDVEIDNNSKKDELKIDSIENFIENSEPINSIIINEISDANECIANAQKEIKSYYKNCKKTYVSKNDEIQPVESKKKNNEFENCPDCKPKPRKSIVVTDQNVKYCMKCSSIFDSDECSYCLTLKQQFVCNFCKISCCCTKKLELHEKNHEKSNENQKIDNGKFKSLFCGECNYKFKDKLDITGHICPKTDEIKNNNMSDS